MAVTPRLAFDGFEVDPHDRRLSRGGEMIALADRHFAVLHHLVTHAGTAVSKSALVAAAWGDVAVNENSLEQAVVALRRALGPAPDGAPYIETIPRRGYRLRAAPTPVVRRETDAGLEALLAPHRAWLEGRAALETLERAQIVRAREVFETVLTAMPGQALPHIGLANACAMRFEMTRADESPDVEALGAAVTHAREACRLDAGGAEAWATLGFVLGRLGQPADALAALRRAVSLEPDNWRHHFRLSYVSWGEERLRAARRTLALLPGFPLAHWLAATVHVARNVLDEAARELDAGIATQDGQGEHARFSAVALHWLRGLIHLARGDDEAAFAAFERELSFESTGHLYARECCANTWYAIGALRLRQGRPDEARAAFNHALERVAAHPLARLALRHAEPAGTRNRPEPGTRNPEPAGTRNRPEPGTRNPEPAGTRNRPEPGTRNPEPAGTRNRPEPGTRNPEPAGTRNPEPGTGRNPDTPSVDAALARAAALTRHGDHSAAAALVDEAMAAAPPGNVGWLLPVEPLLNVASRPSVWALPLSRLRGRSA